MIKFVARISQMGKNTKIIWIPRDIHRQLKSLEGKQLRVTLDDAI